jgi:hypothetical protein
MLSLYSIDENQPKNGGNPDCINQKNLTKRTQNENVLTNNPLDRHPTDVF